MVIIHSNKYTHMTESNFIQIFKEIIEKWTVLFLSFTINNNKMRNFPLIYIAFLCASVNSLWQFVEVNVVKNVSANKVINHFYLIMTACGCCTSVIKSDQKRFSCCRCNRSKRYTKNFQMWLCSCRRTI